MVSVDEVRDFLPSYLSEDSFARLANELRQFQSDNPPIFYTTALAKEQMLFQGDGIPNGPTIRLPNTEIKEIPSFIISNTCDMAKENERLVSTSIVYAPILALHKVLTALLEEYPNESGKIQRFESDVRAQLITHIFFLPKGGRLDHDSVAILDQLNSIDVTSYDTSKVTDTRLFTLSDFGAWLLALKLSIHFCRIRDRVDRGLGVFA